MGNNTEVTPCWNVPAIEEIVTRYFRQKAIKTDTKYDAEFD